MNYSQKTGAGNRILAQGQTGKINSYTFDLLEKVGVWVQSEEALHILKEAGCDLFLMDPHTIEHFRKRFWFPQLMDRTRSGTALSEQDKRLWNRLHEKTAKIRSTESRIAHQR